MSKKEFRITENEISLPFGFSDVFKEIILDQNDTGNFDRSVTQFEKQLQDLKFDSDIDNSFFKEEYDTKLILGKAMAKDFKRSSKFFMANGYKVYFISNKNLGNRVYLATFKDDKIIDFKWIYANYQAEMGFTYYRFFMIDKKQILSVRNYEFTEDPYESKPLLKYQINTDGKFIRYYETDGSFKTDTESGVVKNAHREGLWLEIKENMFLYNSLIESKKSEDFSDFYTLMEANYKDGIIIGEAKFYKMEQDFDDNGKSIISTQKKGKLLYTEVFDR